MALSRCRSCQRHVLPETTACPFCGGRSVLRGAVLLASALAVAGCDKDAAPGDSGATTKSSTPDAPDPEKPDVEKDKPEVDGDEPEIREPVRAIYAGPPPRPDAEPKAVPEKVEPSNPEAADAAPDAPKPE